MLKSKKLICVILSLPFPIPKSSVNHFKSNHVNQHGTTVSVIVVTQTLFSGSQCTQTALT